jgi:hypothetical protein
MVGKASTKKDKRLSIMISSTVYGIEELLEQVYALLSGFGYDVWCSHKGTVTVYPTQTALDSCLAAVEDCDLFLCIITPQYGSGAIPGELGFTHQELLKAIELNKPRWILAHNHIPFLRSVFTKLGCRNAQERENLFAKLGFDAEDEKKELKKREQAVIDDFRVIDMYDAAIRRDLKTYQERTGNWVQKFSSNEDVKLFATAQFGRYGEVEEFIHNHFRDMEAIHKELERRAER